MSSCDRHREYLSAIADGQYDLVPSETVAHARGCDECGREVGTQRRLTRTLAEAGRQAANEAPAPRQPGIPRWRWASAALAAALAVTSVSGTLAWRMLQGEDQVAAAVSVAGQPLQLRSSDGTRIEAWCEQEAERPVPDISSAALEPTGARMDRRGGDEIVTVTYVTGEHRTIRVSWIDATLVAMGASSVRERFVLGSVVLVVTSRAGTAVVSGDAPLDSLWEAAARIQTTA